jgi:hypothetical protein
VGQRSSGQDDGPHTSSPARGANHKGRVRIRCRRNRGLPPRSSFDLCDADLSRMSPQSRTGSLRLWARGHLRRMLFIMATDCPRPASLGLEIMKLLLIVVADLGLDDGTLSHARRSSTGPAAIKVAERIARHRDAPASTPAGSPSNASSATFAARVGRKILYGRPLAMGGSSGAVRFTSKVP